jgi:hypothetical protein
MPLVTYGDRVDMPDTNRVIISSSIDIFTEQGVNIGYISALSRSDNRPTTLVRHLDSVDAGRVVEQAPGPDTTTLNATGYALYNQGANRQSLIHRMVPQVQNWHSLNGQHVPFDIEERATHPAFTRGADPTQGVTATEGGYLSTTYLGSWLTSFNHPVSIGSALIAETCNISVSWVDER